MIWFRAIVFVLAVQVTVVAVVPWLLSDTGPRLDLGGWRALGLASISLGGVLLLVCNVLFVRRGRGTAAPYDPPRALVIEGPYRYVRNPMYLSALLIVGGLGVWLGAALVLGYGLALAVAYHLFVRFYEEPRLLALFGSSYAAYCRSVPRWWPRFG